MTTRAECVQCGTYLQPDECAMGYTCEACREVGQVPPPRWGMALCVVGIVLVWLIARAIH